MLDADTSNNRVESAEVYEAKPEIDLRISTDRHDVWVNVAFEADLVVTNLSRYAALDPIAIGFVLYTPLSLGGDWAGREAFGTRDTPVLPPGGQYVSHVLTVTSRASHQNTLMELVVWPVYGPAGATDSTIWPIGGGNWGIGPGPTLTVHPDYRACEPTLLQPDTVVWAPVICDVPYEFAVFELQAQPDRVYWIEQADTSYITTWLCTDEGERLGGWRTEERSFAEGGTFWIEDGPLPRGHTGPRSLLIRSRPIQTP